MVSTDMVLETGFRNSLKDCLACKAEGPEGCTRSSSPVSSHHFAKLQSQLETTYLATMIAKP